MEMQGNYFARWNHHVLLPSKMKLSEVEVIESAKDAVRMVTGLKFSDYDKVCRKREIAFARQCFSALVRKYTKLSFKEIGKIFIQQYDHSSILTQCKNIENAEDLGTRDPKYIVWLEVQEKYHLIIKWK